MQLDPPRPDPIVIPDTDPMEVDVEGHDSVDLDSDEERPAKRQRTDPVVPGAPKKARARRADPLHPAIPRYFANKLPRVFSGLTRRDDLEKVFEESTDRRTSTPGSMIEITLFCSHEGRAITYKATFKPADELSEEDDF